MPDKYASFSQLAATEPAGSYRIELVSRATSLAVIAPHGGKIEPGSSEVCRAIAGCDRTYYLFEGCKPTNNAELHITSNRFDEPQGLSAAESSRVVVTIHGQAGCGEFVNVGGIEASLGRSVVEQLQAAGFSASRHSNPSLQGLDPANICNRGQSGQGLQMEISRGLRDKLVASGAEMDRFATAIRAALAAHGL